jgi:23S rRNA (adenine2503-C2)-methyltransferase
MRRNLTAGEIVGQVLSLQSDRGTDAKRLNIVIMGMGEPLLNYDNVMKALRLMTDPLGMSISTRRITLSTSGVVPGLERLAQEDLVPNLAISLNATTDEVRDRLIPINRKWNIATLLDACRRFPLEPRRRITFEYVLMEGVNDSEEDALRLVSLLKGVKKKVNLIPLNADPWVPLKKSWLSITSLRTSAVQEETTSRRRAACSPEGIIGRKTAHISLPNGQTPQLVTGQPFHRYETVICY